MTSEHPISGFPPPFENHKGWGSLRYSSVERTRKSAEKGWANPPKLPNPWVMEGDDEANALGRALNGIGAQSLQNPCTIGAFYVASASAGTDMAGLGAEEATADMAAEEGLFPELANGLKNSKLLKYWDKGRKWLAGTIAYGKDLLKSGCNAVQ